MNAYFPQAPSRSMSSLCENCIVIPWQVSSWIDHLFCVKTYEKTSKMSICKNVENRMILQISNDSRKKLGEKNNNDKYHLLFSFLFRGRRRRDLERIVIDQYREESSDNWWIYLKEKTVLIWSSRYIFNPFGISLSLS